MQKNMEILLNEDNKPFNKIEDADYLAESWYPMQVIISTNEGDKICKTARSNAWQPNGEYIYYFIECKM